MEETIRKTRSGKLLGTVVTKKVVKETVEVTFAPNDSSSQENNNQNVELNVISSSTKENEKVEVITSSRKKTPIRSVYVDFGEKVKDQGNKEDEEERRKEELKQKDEKAQEVEEQQQREHVQELEKQQMRDFEEGVRKQQVPPESAPRQLEQEADDQADTENQPQDEDEDETQPASQPDITPTPPPLEKENPTQEEEEEWFEAEGELEQERKGKPQPSLATPPRYEAPPARGEETETKKRKSSQKGAGGGDRSGRKRRRKAKQVVGVLVVDYRTYIYRVLKQVHPDHGISSKAMTTVNSFLNDMYEKIAEEAARLLRHSDGKTMSARDVQDAVKLVLPGELGRHAIAEGAKAVTCYATNTSKG